MPFVLTDESSRGQWPQGMSILAGLNDPPAVERDVASQLGMVDDGDLFMDQFAAL
jgi:hypothetical protein